jgi:hypothetical protein
MRSISGRRPIRFELRALDRAAERIQLQQSDFVTTGQLNVSYLEERVRLRSNSGRTPGSWTATFFEVEFNMTEAISNNGENSTVAIRNEAVTRTEA